MTTKIEWTDETWNPISGCSRASPGCDHCFAKKMASRLAGRYGYDKNNPFQITYHHDKIQKPLRWQKPRRVFVCSMGDIFHADTHKRDIDMVFSRMEVCSRHVFQVLTKRPENMEDKLFGVRADGVTRVMALLGHRYLPNVWYGVTIENDDYCNRFDKLREIPAAKRFVSFEPLLGPITNMNWNDVDWAIVGAETGPGARHMNMEWAVDIYRMCREHNIPFFFKQASQGDAVPRFMTKEFPE